MFTSVTLFFLFFRLLLTAIYVRADPDPNNPGPGDVFMEGKTCVVGWNVDQTGLWKTTRIELMTGSNFDMNSLITVGTVDATDPNKNTFSFTCPQVTPHSPIYFYQFSTLGTSNKTWTGRFTITNSANDIVEPSQSTQPDGSNIAWGSGSLATGSGASSNGTLAISPTASSVASNATTSSASSSPSDTSTPTAVNITTIVVPATPSTVSTTRTNGAAATLSVSDIIFQTGLTLGLAAFGFIVVL